MEDMDLFYPPLFPIYERIDSPPAGAAGHQISDEKPLQLSASSTRSSLRKPAILTIWDALGFKSTIRSRTRSRLEELLLRSNL